MSRIRSIKWASISAMRASIPPNRVSTSAKRLSIPPNRGFDLAQAGFEPIAQAGFHLNQVLLEFIVHGRISSGRPFIDNIESGTSSECILTCMGEILMTAMRWLHITSMATLIGGILYARFTMTPAEAPLPGETRGALDDRAAARFRPFVYAAITCLVISGIFNLLTRPGHSTLYHALFGIKILLALHVFSVAILIVQPGNKRRTRQMTGAAISGLAIILISNYLKSIA
jgi:uncharacterized membrane protein